MFVYLNACDHIGRADRGGFVVSLLTGSIPTIVGYVVPYLEDLVEQTSYLRIRAHPSLYTLGRRELFCSIVLFAAFRMSAYVCGER
jgi:hypothetical protein